MNCSEILRKQGNERKRSSRLKRGIKNKENRKKEEKGTCDNMKRRGAKKAK
jgi:hypothetical protein